MTGMYLEHYGVKGMKWGIRKSPEKRFRRRKKKFDSLAINSAIHTAKAKKARELQALWGTGPQNKITKRYSEDYETLAKLHENSAKEYRDKAIDLIISMRSEFKDVKISDLSSYDNEFLDIYNMTIIPTNMKVNKKKR